VGALYTELENMNRQYLFNTTLLIIPLEYKFQNHPGTVVLVKAITLVRHIKGKSAKNDEEEKGNLLIAMYWMYAEIYSVSVCDSLASPMKKPKSAKYLISLNPRRYLCRVLFPKEVFKCIHWLRVSCLRAASALPQGVVVVVYMYIIYL